MNSSVNNAFPTLQRSNRIIGIDIVKIVAMFLVTILHIVGLGGVVEASDNTTSKLLLSFLYGVSFCCINLFALSTGFLYYGKKAKASRLLQLWIQVVFWAIFANIGPALYRQDVSILTETPFVRVFVVSFCAYWYFTSYVALFFFIPLLNNAIEKISEKQFIFLLTITSIIFCIIPFLFNKDLYRLYKGYSFVWIFYLYILGAGFNKFNYLERIKSKALIIVVIFSAIAIWILTFASAKYELTFFGVSYGNVYEHYNCLPTFLLSISLFLLIGKIKIINTTLTKIIVAFSSSAFSVYLIQCNRSVWREFIENHFSFIAQYQPITVVALTLGISFAIYLSFSLLGYLQNLLFKILKVKAICDWIEKICKIIFSKAYDVLICRCFSK